jgi:DNA-binding protein H-NS
MVGMAAPKKELTNRMRERLDEAVRGRDKADEALWALAAEAVEEGTYEEVAEAVGVAKSTLQDKVREARKAAR